MQLAWLGMEGKPDAVGFDRSFLLPEYLDATRGSNVTASVYMEVNVIGEDQQKEVEYILELCGQSGQQGEHRWVLALPPFSFLWNRGSPFLNL